MSEAAFAAEIAAMPLAEIQRSIWTLKARIQTTLSHAGLNLGEAYADAGRAIRDCLETYWTRLDDSMRHELWSLWDFRDALYRDSLRRQALARWTDEEIARARDLEDATIGSLRAIWAKEEGDLERIYGNVVNGVYKPTAGWLEAKTARMAQFRGVRALLERFHVLHERWLDLKNLALAKEYEASGRG